MSVPVPAPAKAPVRPVPTRPLQKAVAKPASRPAPAKAEVRKEALDDRAEQRRSAMAEAKREKQLAARARELDEQLEEVKKPSWGFGSLGKGKGK